MAFLLLIALIGLCVLSIPAVLAFFIYKKLSNKVYGWAAIAIACALYCFIFYGIYTAVYPNDEFYYEEFKEVTQRAIPKSANILRKEATYPDFHGDYISCSIIRLSKKDYDQLLFELKGDKHFTSQKEKEIIWSDVLENVFGHKNKASIKIGFMKETKYEGSNQLYVGFLNDNETIVVYVCNL